MKHEVFQWAIIGAGPAGIAAVGKLLDANVEPKQILWIDPQFNVGDLGTLWHNVSSNTKVKFFIDFLKNARSFLYENAPDFELNHLPFEKTCTLSYMVEPLQWVTEHLQTSVQTEKTTIHSMKLANQVWHLENNNHSYLAKNVILATGATPTTLDYPYIATLPFEIAIDKIKLKQAINTDKTYAVFGSSHSAIMIINYLVDLGVKKVINFYRSPCRYAVDMGDWILFDNTGLKGHTAAWAREHIDGTLPKSLVRYRSNATNIERFLSKCDKVIYAVGFNRRDSISIGDYEHKHYNPHVGIIAPGLFGLGIAYPEVKADPFGSVETQVGLWKFMVYLNKVLPVWFKYHV